MSLLQVYPFFLPSEPEYPQAMFSNDKLSGMIIRLCEGLKAFLLPFPAEILPVDQVGLKEKR